MFFKRADRVVTLDRRPLAKVKHAPNGEAEVLWNSAEVASTGIQKQQVLEELERVLPAPQWASSQSFGLVQAATRAATWNARALLAASASARCKKVRYLVDWMCV